MSAGNAPARQRATDHATNTPTTALRREAPGAARAPGPEAPECASLAHILDTRNHRPMLRLQALQIIEGVCRSLDHTHRNGGIHGDVRPEQIFVTSEGHVRLTGHGDTPTPAWASCEVLEGAPPVAADDLFSAACTGYQLLAGEPAFTASNALKAESVGQRPARIPHLSPGQWRALDRALAFRRADRQPDIESFLNELRSQYPGQSDADATATVLSLPVADVGEHHSPPLQVMVVSVAAIATIVSALGWWLLRAPDVPVSTDPPSVAASTTETGRILRTEVAPLSEPALQVPPATKLPAAAAEPVSVAAPQPHAAERVAAAPAITTISNGTETTAFTSATASPDAISAPAPETVPVPLLTPRVVVPTLTVPPAPDIGMADTQAADNVYTVPFSSLKVRHYVDPDYPRNRRGIRTAGWVDVSFGISEAGRTTGLQVTGAEPGGIFEEAALAAVRRWRFAPVDVPPGAGTEVRSEIRVRFIPD